MEISLCKYSKIQFNLNCIKQVSHTVASALYMQMHAMPGCLATVMADKKMFVGSLELQQFHSRTCTIKDTNLLGNIT